MERVALYLRVSTSDQDCAMQESELRDYCQRRQWEVCEVYQDVMSGAKDRRPALTRLVADARRGRFQVVACYRLDRLGRSLQHLIATVDQLHKHGVDFVSMTEAIDFTGPTGQLMFHLLASFAEFERQVIRQRVKSGVAEAKRRGKHCGRPRAVVDADRIESMRQAGLSWSRIAADLSQKVGAVRTAHKRYLALQKVSLAEGSLGSVSAAA
jgi:DNA invertase Pin-like site-specific DNA recombinase